jgi:preprotein translocase subunit SecE
MAKDEEETERDSAAEGAEDAGESAPGSEAIDAEAQAPSEQAADDIPANLGATRYVHAAFFAAAILVAYVSGKMLALIWNRLAEWPAAVKQVPVLLRYAEDEREGFTMGAGALVGLIAVIQTYRTERIRGWANEVALELTKVTWPNREMVTNGTIVVVIASMIATVYVMILDRFWGYLTQLVYGV